MNLSDKRKLKFAIKQIIKEELAKGKNVNEGIFGMMAGALKSALGSKQTPSQPAPMQPAPEKPPLQLEPSNPIRQSNERPEGGYRQSGFELGTGLSYTSEEEKFAEALKTKNFSGMILFNKDFSGKDLSESNFTNTIFNDVKFKGANLTGANFTNAKLEKVDLTGTNLEGANLEGTNLADTILEGANLEGANLTRTNLGNANLYKAKLKGTNFTGATIGNIAGFVEANLEDTNFTGATLTRTDFYGANLTGANFTNATLNRVDLDKGNLSRTNFTNATLNGVDLIDANLKGTNFTDATFSYSNLRNTVFDSDTIFPDNDTFDIEGIIDYYRMRNLGKPRINFRKRLYSAAGIGGSEGLKRLDPNKFVAAIRKMIEKIKEMSNSLSPEDKKTMINLIKDFISDRKNISAKEKRLNPNQETDLENRITSQKL